MLSSVLVLIICITSAFCDSNKFLIRECRLNNCLNALDECIIDDCNSEFQCKQCIERYNPECLPCAEDIFSTKPEVIDGKEYQLCESTNEYQIRACEFYCRATFRSKGQCEDLRDLVVCNCDPSPTTTGISTTARKEPGTLIRTLNNHTRRVDSLELLSNGFIASGSQDSRINIWNPLSGELIKNLGGHRGFIYALALLDNGYLASGSDDRSILIWDPNSDWRLVRTISSTGRVFALESLDNGRLAASNENDIRIIDSTGRQFGVLTGHINLVRDILWLENGDLASCGQDNSIRIWNLKTYQLIRTLLGHKSAVFSIEQLPNDNIVSGSSDQTMKVWDPSTGTLILDRPGNSTFIDFKVLEKNHLAVGTGSSLEILNMNNWNLTATINGPSNYVTSLELLSNGNLASGYFEGLIGIWRINL